MPSRSAYESPREKSIEELEEMVNLPSRVDEQSSAAEEETFIPIPPPQPFLTQDNPSPRGVPMRPGGLRRFSLIGADLSAPIPSTLPAALRESTTSSFSSSVHNSSFRRESVSFRPESTEPPGALNLNRASARVAPTPLPGSAEAIKASQSAAAKEKSTSSSTSSTSPTAAGAVPRLALPTDERNTADDSRESTSRTPRSARARAQANVQVISAKQLAPGLMAAWDLYWEYGVVSPQGKYIARWDVVMVVLLAFIALVTPYEVAFLNPTFNWLFIVNRIVDTLFVVDIVMNFMLAFYDEAMGQICYDRYRIMRRYVMTWFIVDVVSILPFDTLSVAQAGVDGRLKSLRVMKVVRLVKVARILRIGRINARTASRWSAYAIDYNLISLLNHAATILMLSHWLACLWRLVVELENDPLKSWMASEGLFSFSFVEDQQISGKQLFEVYQTCLYWSVMTTTTIGYGDITPKTTAERLYATVAMLVGAAGFGYIIGAVGNAVTVRSSRRNLFSQRMDDLNFFLTDQKVPIELRKKLREFFQYDNSQNTVSLHNELLGQMSPELRGRVLMHLNRTWTRHVPLFKSAPNIFIMQVAMLLTKHTYPPEENIISHGEPAAQLFILHRGVAAGRGGLFTIGHTLGEDALLRDNTFRSYSVRAITFVELSQLQRHDLFAILEHFPNVKHRWSAFAIKIIFREEVLAYARAKRMVEEQVNVDQKRNSVSQMSMITALNDDRVQHYYQKLKSLIVNPFESSRRAAAATRIQARIRKWLIRSRHLRQRNMPPLNPIPPHKTASAVLAIEEKVSKQQDDLDEIKRDVFDLTRSVTEIKDLLKTLASK
mmetsp:Transcript_23836/g.77516  ORF Transcript_23836/g.77516 Transcript_23836/m.77516 type:complete len:832 (-) Transcript_23836:97-2592(-)